MTSFVAFFYGLARLNAEIYLCKLHFVIAVRSSLLYVILKLGHPLLSFHSARAKVSQQSLFASTVHCSVNVAQLFTSFDSYLGLQRLLSGWTVDNVNNMESWKVSDNKCESFQQNRTSIGVHPGPGKSVIPVPCDSGGEWIWNVSSLAQQVVRALL